MTKRSKVEAFRAAAPYLAALLAEHRAKIVDSPRAESASRDACGGTVTAISDGDAAA